MTETILKLVQAYGPKTPDLAQIDPDSPQAYAYTRALATTLVKNAEAHWWTERSRDHQERLAAEHRRLVQAFVGPDGLDSKAWKNLPRKLLLLAQRVVGRDDTLAFQQFRVDQLPAEKVAAELLPQINALILKERAARSQEHAAAASLPSSPKRSSGLDFKQPGARGDSRLLGFQPTKGGAGGGADTEPSPLLRKQSILRFKGLARDIVADSRTLGTFGKGFSLESARKLRAMRSSFTSLVAMRSQLSPLCQQLLDVCMSLDAPGSSELIPMVGAAELDGNLMLTGISMHVSTARALSNIIPSCTFLTMLHISRTVLPPEALAYLIPVAASLPLTTVELISTDLRRQSWPVLVAALVRPTQLGTLAQPSSHLPTSHRPHSSPSQSLGSKMLLDTSGRPLAPNWWLTLRSLNLSGNTLGDEGLQVLSPHLCALQALRQLVLKHTGIMDWSAPQLEILLREARALEHLDLSNNQMGPICAQAIATSLPNCPRLSHLALAWNTFGGGLQDIAWALVSMAQSSGPRGQLQHLDLSGNSLTHQDQMSFAVLLRVGRCLPLRELDISHNDLVGVAGQCLLRQAFPARPSGQQGSDSTSQRPGSGSGPRAGAGPAAVQVRVKGCALGAPLSAAAMDEAPGRERSEGNAGASPSRPGWGSPARTSGPDGVRMPVIHRAMSMMSRSASLAANSADWGAALEQAMGRSGGNGGDGGAGRSTHNRESGGEMGAGPTAQFSLDLGKRRSDRLVAQLLVEHELHARSRHYMAWLGVMLDDVQYRKGGVELQAFDVLYEGWSSDEGMPETGQLVLDVRAVRDADCPWVLQLQLDNEEEED